MWKILFLNKIFNFDENPELKQFFVSTKDVKRIIENLSLVHGKTIQPQNTLIIFDEIQESNEALNTLKYFAENAPEYHIAYAGSLLGVAMSRGASFPVGKVDFMNIYPISLRQQSKLAPNAIAEGNRLLTEFKGALTENYILGSLMSQFEDTPRYWTSGNRAEVDFILQLENDIIPIEVKADENVIGKSLTFYRKEFFPKLSIRYSLKNLKQDGDFINIPLFMADLTKQFIAINQNIGLD